MGKDDGSRAALPIGETQTILQQIKSVTWSLRVTNAGPQRPASVWEGMTDQI